MITVGMKGTQEIVVTEELLAVNIGSGNVTVFATPMMVAGIEGTAVAAVAPALAEGQTTVGTMINMSHVAATPAGMRVRFDAEVTEVSENGKIITFRVEAHDETGLIGEGTHQRAIVNKARFEMKAAAKLDAKKQ